MTFKNITITFECEAAETAARLLKSEELAKTIYDIDMYLRSETKYNEHSDEVYEVYDKLREKIREICIDNSIDFELLT